MVTEASSFLFSYKIQSFLQRTQSFAKVVVLFAAEAVRRSRTVSLILRIFVRNGEKAARPQAGFCAFSIRQNSKNSNRFFVNILNKPDDYFFGAKNNFCRAAWNLRPGGHHLADEALRYFSRVAMPPRMCRSALLTSSTCFTCKYSAWLHLSSRSERSLCFVVTN